MAGYRFLDDVWAEPDWDLKRILYCYDNEKGTVSSNRSGLLGKLLEKLLRHDEKARQFQSERTGKAKVTGVKELADWHASKHQDVRGAKQAELNAEVIRIRKWLSRQGAWIVYRNGHYELADDKNQFVVVYDEALEAQEFSKIEFRGGRLYTADGEPLDTRKMVSAFSGPGFGIYVVSKERHLHVRSHVVGHVHHSSLLNGANTACAGEIEVHDGQLKWLSNKSGHYHPEIRHMYQVLALMQHQSVPMVFELAELDGRDVVQFGSVNEFMVHHQVDDENMRRVASAMTTVITDDVYVDPPDGPGPVTGAYAYVPAQQAPPPGFYVDPGSDDAVYVENADDPHVYARTAPDDPILYQTGNIYNKTA